jgi:hypothetical protein
MPSSYVSGRVISDQTEHSRAIIVGYVPSGHYFPSRGIAPSVPGFHEPGSTSRRVRRLVHVREKGKTRSRAPFLVTVACLCGCG